MKSKLSNLFQRCQGFFSADKEQIPYEQSEFERHFKNFYEHLGENTKGIAYDLADLREQNKPRNHHNSPNADLDEFAASYNFFVSHVEDSMRTIAHDMATEIENGKKRVERSSAKEMGESPSDENRLWGGTASERPGRMERLLELARNYTPVEHHTKRETPHLEPCQ